MPPTNTSKEFKALPALPRTGGEKGLESGEGAVSRPSHEPKVENSLSRDKSGDCTARLAFQPLIPDVPFLLSASKKAEAAQLRKKEKQDTLQPLLGVNVDGVDSFHPDVFLLNTKMLQFLP